MSILLRINNFLILFLFFRNFLFFYFHKLKIKKKKKKIRKNNIKKLLTRDKIITGIPVWGFFVVYSG